MSNKGRMQMTSHRQGHTSKKEELRQKSDEISSRRLVGNSSESQFKTVKKQRVAAYSRREF